MNLGRGESKKQKKNNLHFGVHLLGKQTRRAQCTDKGAITSRSWLTFHYHVEVVHVLSRGVCRRAHVLATVALLRRRQGQELAVVQILGSGRHLLPHFHPLHLGSGAAAGEGGI